jgi:hypothetical protein
VNAARPLPADGGTGLRSRFSPESVAIAIIVIVAVSVSLPSYVPKLSFGGGPGASPAASLPLLTPPPESRYDTGSVGLVLELNRLIGQSEQPLKEALGKRQLDPTAIRSELSRIVVNVRLGLDVAARLQARAESRKLGEHVADYYEGLRAIADRSFKAALANEAAHRRAAEDMIAALDKRSELDSELKAFLKKAEAEQARPSPTPVPSPSTPAGAPSAVPTPSNVASPASGGKPGELVVNGSFEDGPTPWRLSFRDPAALADSSVDRAQARVGQASLRIEIAAGSDSRSGIAVEQSGLSIAGDSRYVVRLFAQAETPREIRVAVVSSSGATYGGRVFDVGTTWTALEFEFTALRSDDGAGLEVDLGRSTKTVWLDAISVVREAN